MKPYYFWICSPFHTAVVVSLHVSPCSMEHPLSRMSSPQHLKILLRSPTNSLCQSAWTRDSPTPWLVQRHMPADCPEPTLALLPCASLEALIGSLFLPSLDLYGSEILESFTLDWKQQLKAAQQGKTLAARSATHMAFLCSALIWLVWEYLLYCSHNSDYSKCSLIEGSQKSQKWSEKRNSFAHHQINSKSSIHNGRLRVKQAGVPRAELNITAKKYLLLSYTFWFKCVVWCKCSCTTVVIYIKHIAGTVQLPGTCPSIFPDSWGLHMQKHNIEEPRSNYQSCQSQFPFSNFFYYFFFFYMW